MPFKLKVSVIVLPFSKVKMILFPSILYVEVKLVFPLALPIFSVAIYLSPDFVKVYVLVAYKLFPDEMLYCQVPKSLSSFCAEQEESDIMQDKIITKTKNADNDFFIVKLLVFVLK